MNRPNTENIKEMNDGELWNIIYKFEEYCDELESRNSPIKVKNKGEGYIKYKFDCPRCKTQEIMWLSDDIKYCPMCGQRVEIVDD